MDRVANVKVGMTYLSGTGIIFKCNALGINQIWNESK